MRYRNRNISHIDPVTDTDVHKGIEIDAASIVDRIRLLLVESLVIVQHTHL